MQRTLTTAKFGLSLLLALALCGPSQAAITVNLAAPPELVANIYSEGTGSLTISPLTLDDGFLAPSVPLGKQFTSYLVKLSNPAVSSLTPYELEVDFGGKILGIQSIHPNIRTGRFLLKAEPDFSPVAPQGGLEAKQGDVASISGSILHVTGKLIKFDSIRVIVQAVPEAATTLIWSGVMLGGVIGLRTFRRSAC